MANSSIVLSNLDFDTLKNTFKQHLKSQDRFRDYDFDGSNLNVLLDILTYNTHMNAFYLNMIGNEMFLDSSVMYDSVVSHAKELNYTPKSFKSSQAEISIAITTSDMDKRSITIPKGTSFTSRLGNKNFTFSVAENVVLNTITTGQSTLTFTGNLTLFEGNYITDTFTVNSESSSKFVLSNQNIDTSSISVSIIEDMGATVIPYTKAESLFNLDSTSKVFFIQGAPNHSYEIVFGDNISGRKPKNNSVVTVEYRVCNGELPNGCTVFKTDGSIDGETNIAISTLSKAASGAISESIESIKFNAPRHFTTQERAVTTEDYETLMKLNFPEVNSVSAYGGEDLDPPQYGKVFVSVDLKEVDGLPQVKRNEYYKFLKPRSPVSIDPVFVDPDYMYVYCESIVRYNVNSTRLNPEDIRTLVASAILGYASSNLNDFNSTLRYSKLLQTIDKCHPSIVSNESTVKIIKTVKPLVGTSVNLTVDFGQTLLPTTQKDIGLNAVRSSAFVYNGQEVYLEDDGAGAIRIVTSPASGHVVLREIGTINYTTGTINVSNLIIDSFGNRSGVLTLYATPKSLDIYSQKNTILNIRDSDLLIQIEQVRE